MINPDNAQHNEPNKEDCRTVRAFIKCGDSFEVEAEDHPTRLVRDLDGFDAGQTPDLSRYGGWKSEPLEATGYFRTEKIDDRWWLVDPQGYRFLHIAVNGVNPGNSDRMQAALKEKYGSPEGWRDHTLRLLKEHGFNGTGCWSRDALNREAPPDLRPVYTPTLRFMGGYGRERGGTYTLPGHRGYPHNCIFVFEDGFKEYARREAAGLAERADDSYLLGYFTDNELPFPDNLLDCFLELPPGDAGYEAVHAWLRERKGARADASAITDVDREQWRAHVLDRYLSVVTDAIRQHDPHHLILGPRFYGPEKQSEPFWQTAGRYLDVIAVNDYCVWTPSAERLGQWAEWSGSPIMLTEWYAKGEDSGLPNQSGAGWTVATQQERGWFYQNFVLGLLESRVCVGWHWFKYADNDPEDTRTDPSNRDSNKGIVNVEYEPYQPLMRAMKELNRVAYPLTAHFDHP
ncbi:MAG: hypothetical protein R6X33_13615 [Candidatus Brocadiia bacterium]